MNKMGHLKYSMLSDRNDFIKVYIKNIYMMNTH